MTDLNGLDELDLRRRAAMAADYRALQGLGTTALGLGVGVIAWGHPAWAGLVAVGGGALAVRWYRHRYGQTVPRGSRVRALLLGVLASAGCLAALLLDESRTWPVSLFPLAVAVTLVGSFRIGYAHIGVTWWHWVVAAAVGLCCLAPSAGLGVEASHRVSVGAAAVGLIVIGLVDHLRLMRLMKPPRRG